MTARVAAVLAFTSLTGGCSQGAGATAPATTATQESGGLPSPSETVATASAPPTSPPTSTSDAAPAASGSGSALTRGRCKTDADCPAAYVCELGMPLRGTCWKKGVPAPICLSADTRIDTPMGPRPVCDLRAGDEVFTTDASGQRVAAPLLQASHVGVPRSHEMVHLTLDDGRELLVSPGHPTCGARRSAAAPSTLADLTPGSPYDGSAVRTAERVPYGSDATFDILPAGSSGCYWANGVLLGSTLFAP